MCSKHYGNSCSGIPIPLEIDWHLNRCLTYKVLAIELMELNVCLKSSSVWKYFAGSKPSSGSELHKGSCLGMLSQKSTLSTDAHVSWPSAFASICSAGMCSLASCLDCFLTVPGPSNGDWIGSAWCKTAPHQQNERSIPFHTLGQKVRLCVPKEANARELIMTTASMHLWMTQNTAHDSRCFANL